jgi:hypothetical protein
MNAILQNLYQLQTLDLAGTKHNSAHVAGLRAGIPATMLTNYDRARARGKKSIASVRNNVCSNCRIQTPIAVTASLMGGLVQVCGNCGLYLCLLEPQEQAPPQPAPTPRKTKPRKKKILA